MSVNKKFEKTNPKFIALQRKKSKQLADCWIAHCRAYITLYQIIFFFYTHTLNTILIIIIILYFFHFQFIKIHFIIILIIKFTLLIYVCTLLNDGYCDVIRWFPHAFRHFQKCSFNTIPLTNWYWLKEILSCVSLKLNTREVIHSVLFPSRMKYFIIFWFDLTKTIFFWLIYNFCFRSQPKPQI